MSNNFALTKREIIFLIALGVLMLIFSIIPQQTIKNYEPLIIIFIGFPLGLWVAIDPERGVK